MAVILLQRFLLNLGAANIATSNFALFWINRIHFEISSKSCSPSTRNLQRSPAPEELNAIKNRENCSIGSTRVSLNMVSSRHSVYNNKPNL